MISAELSPQNDAQGALDGHAGSAHRPTVAVLMATYNGEKYLREQLDSIAAQTLSNWIIWASDDGSTDQTRSILQQYQGEFSDHRVRIVTGPGRGFSKNFIQLICRPELNAEFFAFADQDDIWDDDKLQIAVDWLQSTPKDVPALYCSRTRLITADGRSLGPAPLFARKPHFANALVQSLTNGNTMVMNQAARQLIQTAGNDVDVFSHDWWTYMLVTGCGGQVHYDPIPRISYRQHANNLLGMNMGFAARLKRFRLAWGGRYRDWNDRNIRALARVHHMLTKQAQTILYHFERSRYQGLIGRVAGLMKSGVYRRTLFENISITIMTICKKM